MLSKVQEPKPANFLGLRLDHTDKLAKPTLAARPLLAVRKGSSYLSRQSWNNLHQPYRPSPFPPHADVNKSCFAFSMSQLGAQNRNGVTAGHMSAMR